MTDKQVQSINPATGEVIESFTPLSAPGIDTALNKAADAFRAWRTVVDMCDELADELREIESRNVSGAPAE